jgi:hypothetical protein
MEYSIHYIYRGSLSIMSSETTDQVYICTTTAPVWDKKSEVKNESVQWFLNQKA